jgi:hypothetical protein
MAGHFASIAGNNCNFLPRHGAMAAQRHLNMIEVRIAIAQHVWPSRPNMTAFALR